MSDTDTQWMQMALQQAQLARGVGEVPVGAVVVCNDECIAASHNSPIADHDPTAHAEMNVLRKAAHKTGNYRLQDCTVYVTLEPCAMCAMAMLHARVKRVVFGAFDPKTGAAGSVVNLFDKPLLNHQTSVSSGVLQEECSHLLKNFFQQKRADALKVPVREDALRTPQARFDPFSLKPSYYVTDLAPLAGLQLHYHYVQPPEQAKSLLLLIHDEHGSSEQYADVIDAALNQGHAVLVPDLIGFGRSDKPKKRCVHTSAFHASVLAALVGRLKEGLGEYVPITLVLPQSLSALVTEVARCLPGQLLTVALLQELPSLAKVVEAAPFPDKGHRAAIHALGQWAQIQDMGALEEGCSGYLPALRVASYANLAAWQQTCFMLGEAMHSTETNCSQSSG